MTKHEKKGSTLTDKKHNNKKQGTNHGHALQHAPGTAPEHDKHGKDKHETAKTKEQDPTLTKRDIKQIEKLEAKIEFHEARDEHDQADLIRDQILSIKDHAKEKAMKKAEKMSAANAE